MIGDDRPFISALVVLDPDVAPAWAQAHGIDATTLAELADAPGRASPRSSARSTRRTPRFSQVEQIKRFDVLDDEWLPDSEELTPTMKLKRRGIHRKYADEIEALYA